MSDELKKEVDPLQEASFLEGQQDIAKKISQRRHEEQQEAALNSVGNVGKKAIEVIGEVKALAGDGDPDKVELAAFITKTVKHAVMGSGQPGTEEARVAGQATPLSENSPRSTPNLQGSTPKSIDKKAPEKQGLDAPKKRGRPPKNSNG